MTVGGTNDTVAETVGSRLWLGNLVQPNFKHYLFRIFKDKNYYGSGQN